MSFSLYLNCQKKSCDEKYCKCHTYFLKIYRYQFLIAFTIFLFNKFFHQESLVLNIQSCNNNNAAQKCFGLDVIDYVIWKFFCFFIIMTDTRANISLNISYFFSQKIFLTRFVLAIFNIKVFVIFILKYHHLC